MKEFFSSFFSSANIIERAKALIINALALSGHTNDNTIIRRVSLRLPWAMRLLGFQPVLEACKPKWPPERYHALCAYTPSGRMFMHLTDEPFFERISMFLCSLVCFWFE